MTASSKVTNYGVRLRPDLYEHLPPYPTEQESVEAERQLKADLEAIGYRVWGATKVMYEAFPELRGAKPRTPSPLSLHELHLEPGFYCMDARRVEP